MIPDQKAKCQICRKVFVSKSSKANAQRHFRNVHSNMSAQPCIICKTLFKNKEKYQAHLKKDHKVSMKQVKEAKIIQITGQDSFLEISPKHVVRIKKNHKIAQKNFKIDIYFGMHVCDFTKNFGTHKDKIIAMHWLFFTFIHIYFQICSRCNTTISSRANAWRHYRKKHNSDPELSRPVRMHASYDPELDM